MSFLPTFPTEDNGRVLQSTRVSEVDGNAHLDTTKAKNKCAQSKMIHPPKTKRGEQTFMRNAEIFIVLIVLFLTTISQFAVKSITDAVVDASHPLQLFHFSIGKEKYFVFYFGCCGEDGQVGRKLQRSALKEKNT